MGFLVFSSVGDGCVTSRPGETGAGAPALGRTGASGTDGAGVAGRLACANAGADPASNPARASVIAVGIGLKRSGSLTLELAQGLFLVKVELLASIRPCMVNVWQIYSPPQFAWRKRTYGP
jgi:hypothetical protein